MRSKNFQNTATASKGLYYLLFFLTISPMSERKTSNMLLKIAYLLKWEGVSELSFSKKKALRKLSVSNTSAHLSIWQHRDKFQCPSLKTGILSTWPCFSWAAPLQKCNFIFLAQSTMKLMLRFTPSKTTLGQNDGLGLFGNFVCGRKCLSLLTEEVISWPHLLMILHDIYGQPENGLL